MAGPHVDVNSSALVDTELKAISVSDQPPVSLLCRTDELLNTIDHTIAAANVLRSSFEYLSASICLDLFIR